MRSYLHIFLFVLLGLGAKAQQNYFVYVQADDKQPFYVKLNDKLLSSSATGYIVIPKLVSGNYTLTVGFPKDGFPEQSLAITVGNADAGYLLKNFGDKGWGLYNIQTAVVTMTGSSPDGQTTGSSDDAFTAALSGAANASLSIIKPVNNDEPKAEPVPVVILSAIEKISGADEPDGRSMIYADHSGQGIDTIRVFIPTAVAVPVNDNEPVAQQNTAVTAPVKDTKFLNIELPNPNNAAPDSVKKDETHVDISNTVTPVKQADKPIVSFNSDCHANAGDEDFVKVRKKMTAQTDEDVKVETAAKYFKQKCYSVDQVRNLSLLFLTDAGKYKFLDAAYPHTYDTQNFSSLQSELHDEYYINRFKAMVRN